LAISALLFCGALAAQPFKCTSTDGKVTYAEKKCSELGLQDAGEVKDRINVTPAYRPPPKPIPPPPSAAPAAAASTGSSGDAPKPDSAAESPKPERRCFATANGTRCNDTPAAQ
jgi:hypothetical protein